METAIISWGIFWDLRLFSCEIRRNSTAFADNHGDSKFWNYPVNPCRVLALRLRTQELMEIEGI